MTNPAADKKGATRISALDFTKGALVIFMVIYHALNYSAWRALPFQYMAFLPPSFILITGFLLTNIYTAKYSSNNTLLYRRLMVRGLRLVLIFTLLNVVGNACFARNYNGQRLGLTAFLQEWQGIYIFGGSPLASFEILLPIGYLLLAAPLLLRLHFVSRYLILGLVVCLIVSCVFLEMANQSWAIANLLSVGLIGVAAGAVPLTKVGALAKQWPWVIGSYAAYWVCRSLWGHPYLVQVMAACASVLLIYAVAIRLPPGLILVEEVNRLGRYSLLSYIAQIAILQIIYRVHIYNPASVVAVFCLGMATLVATWGVVLMVEWLRRCSAFFDQLYRATFG